MTTLDDFPIGSTVALKTFWSTTKPSIETDPGNNYWLLVGSRGTVVSTDEIDKLGRHRMGPRVLVRFDVDVSRLGLHCHNPIPNALYIFVDDLETIPEANQSAETLA